MARQIKLTVTIMTMMVKSSLLEDLVMEVREAKTVRCSMALQFFHRSGVRLIDRGTQRQNINYPTEHRVIVIYQHQQQ